MKNAIKSFFKYLDESHRVWFLVLSLCSVARLVASFLTPPMGVIDGSVIAAVGELFAFSALGTFLDAIHLNKKASVRKGSLEISIDGKDD